MIDAVIFDLFGTLIHLPRDTNPYLQLCRAIGDSTRIRDSLVVDAPTLADFCDHLDVSHPQNLTDIQRDLDADVDNAARFADSLPALQSLRDRGLRTALISNLASPYKRAVDLLNLEPLFDTILYSCDVGLAKPNPDIYRHALSKLNTTAESTLMVGDSQRSDVDGPMAVGIRGFLIDRNGQSSGDSVLRALTDVTSYLGS
ncbi:Haloacid dehalogenase-like hydrolase domain protein [Rhodopirellula maiorica SM1]|uniref:Haloacid dehalogenase-like hydrolase domain protein n=1 Tax=Rhodopirellula maiorica SM1 TaxID=1265738 RepID=M5RZV4_9BACT|nr:HAD family hydrolase [Rhodopirellula maiorica]EMI19454.1 Haloacid dehalogenase-like hydrolase domain protein [Rhodopirellula maiorica SM1]